MRKLVLLTLLATAAAAQDSKKQQAYEIKYLEQKADKKIYLQGQEGPFTGLGVERYSSGKPKFQIGYETGIQHGVTTIWWENGKTHTQQTFQEGKQEGKSLFWFESGMKKSESEYKDGLQQGWTIFWYKSGRKRSAQYWNQGQKTGPYQEWHDSGELGKEPLKLEGEYNDGKRHNIWKHYSTGNTMEHAYQFDNGRLKRIRQWGSDGKILVDKVVQ